MSNQPTDQLTHRPTDQPTNSWYVIRTKPRRELLVADQLTNDEELTIFLPEVLQQGVKGAKLTPFFPSYLFVQVDLKSRAAGVLVHTPGVIGFVGSERQPVAVADAIVRTLQERVAEVNAQGGLSPHAFQVGDPVQFKSGPLQGLEAVFVGPLQPTQRVQVLLHFLGQQQQVEVNVHLLEPGRSLQETPKLPPPRRTRGHGRPIHNHAA